ncbi:AsmA family protein [Chitinophaga agrisoli]|uniref:AsmA family protein n=1 Tax=Chitinophaga agrisoli TaxID=2607653 RepID=A0A5B2VHG7_9BACT|nr:AsmA-like C-terminal region-containing protein [Chitinophaga agrisoli]KAA2238571.1 AsmA family protein [Chitinophaga agrisoli]
MPKWLRIVIRIGAVLLGCFILLWLVLALYIHLNRQSFLKQLTGRLNQGLNGTLTIGDISPSLLRSFPHMSMALDKVELQDSLCAQHHHPLLSVKRIFVKVNTFSVFRRRLDIREITMEDGTIYLYTNEQGYTNTHVFASRKEKTTGNGSGKDAAIASLELHNMLFVVDNQQKNKLFQVNIYTLRGSMAAMDSAWRFKIRTRAQVNSFSFNTERGSYLKDRILETSLEINVNRATKTLTIPAQRIDINQQPVKVGAVFTFGEKPVSYTITIAAAGMPYHTATGLLLPHLTQKLDSIQLEKPLDVDARIKGYMREHDTPDIRVNWKTANNVLVTKAGEWSDCSFSGNFRNEAQPGLGHNDENSAVTFYGFKAKWWGIPLSADTLRILNLKRPELMGRFKSEFPLMDLNDLASETFAFTKGMASADLYYKGSVLAGDTAPTFLKGAIHLSNGALSYLPRDLQFHDCNAVIEFTGQDMYFRNVKAQSAKSAIQMDGSVRNLLALYFSAPEKILVDWNIRSPQLDLDEFRFFLAPRKKQAHKGGGSSLSRKASRMARQLDVVLDACNVNMRVQLDQLNYRRFNAQRVVADLRLTQTDILLQQISLAHAGGSLMMRGAIHQQGNNNRFKLNTDIRNVHIDQLFYAFDNFGMQSLTSKNLKGILSARADITGNLYDKGKITPRSLYGTLSFDLRQGALVHFEPLENIGNFFFRKRNLSNITFDNLQNTLQLQGNKIIIPPMQIASSALNMDVTGVYGMPTGTDIYLDVPLRNPKKEKKNKGIVLHLRATDDNKEGKVKIKLGRKKEVDSLPTMTEQ